MAMRPTAGDESRKCGMGAHELEREATLLGRRLAKTQGHVAQLGRKWRRYSSHNGYRRAVASVAAEVVEAMREKGWLIAAPDGNLRLSAQGATAVTPVAPDVFRRQHQLRAHRLRETPDGGRTMLAVNEAESPLAWLLRRKDADGAAVISPEQFEAGERLRRDYELGQLAPRLTVRLDLPLQAGARDRAANRFDGLTDNERALAARERLHKALAEVGPELAGSLVEICCLEKGIEAAERALGLPQRSGKVVLKLALTRLARFYGLLPAEPTRNGPAHIRHWGEAGYRPSFPGS